MTTPKLTPTQHRVMDWMGKGWPAHQTHGNAVSINGKRVCNRDTINVLVRLGLVGAHPESRWTFVATPAGRTDPNTSMENER